MIVEISLIAPNHSLRVPQPGSLQSPSLESDRVAHADALVRDCIRWTASIRSNARCR